MSAQFTASKTRSVLTKILTFFAFVYMIALTSSMAAMEFGTMGYTLFFVLIAITDRFCKTKIIEWHTTGVELPIFGFIATVFVGLLVNAPNADFLFVMGSLRLLLVFFIITYSLQIVKDLNRLFAVMLFCATVIGVYAIWQHYTGIDLWRHTHRALVDLPIGDRSLYQSVGFFGHHLTYAHSYMMILCLPWAALLLGNRQPWWQRILFLLSFLIILTSVGFTYGRGAWIAVAVSLPVMAMFVSRKILISIILIFIIAGGAVYKISPTIHERVVTIFQENYASNDDRKKLWQANMQMFKEHPWIGIGYRQNEPLTMAYYEKLGIKDGMSGHAHSNYIQTLATTGLIGFTFYMLLMLAFILTTARLYASIPSTHYWHRVIALAALGAQVAFHIGGLTQWNFGDALVHHQFLFWLAVVAYMSQRYYAHIVPDDQSI